MAIKAVDLFLTQSGQQLDFTDQTVDVVDMFNTAVAQPVNDLLLSTGVEDPFIEGQEETLEKTREFRESLNEQTDDIQKQQSDFGFQNPQQDSFFDQDENTPEDDMRFLNWLRSLGQKKTESATPSRPSGGNKKFDPASFTFEREARRDSRGRVSVYTPPSGDGGGSFEVAGITQRYQPKESARLRSLIMDGRYDEAEMEAKDFYRKRAAPFVKHASQPGLQLQMADSVHHRGEGGLRRILQRATGSKSRNYQTLISQLDRDPKALSKFNKARSDYEWDEIDRGRSSRKKFRKGLKNRFDQANRAAVSANNQL